MGRRKVGVVEGGGEVMRGGGGERSGLWREAVK